jgi:hypothetical protein
LEKWRTTAAEKDNETMLVRTKIIIVAATAVALIGGTAGAVATASALTVHDQTGVVQKLAPVTTGPDSGTSGGSDDPTPSPTSTPQPMTTVAPAPPAYVDDHGNHTDDDPATHDLGDDNGGQSGGGSGHGGNDDSSGHH